MAKVLCASLNGNDGPHLELLRAAGFDVQFPPEGANLFTEADLIAALDGCVAAIAGSEPYTRNVIESAPFLRVIARSGVGFDAVDLAACDEASIVVATTPGVNHHAVAEHAIALLMGVARGFPEADRQVRENCWKRVARPRVMGSTIGIVGLGRIGQAVATRAVGLGMQVIALEPYPNQEFVDQWKIRLTDLEDLLARADYVSLHVPVTPETHHLINRQTLAKMKSGSVLINTSRGLLVDESALYEALKSGHVRAAGLDVFEVEPLPLTSPLLELDNVLTSGHIAGLDNESHHDTFEMVADIIISLRDGGWPSHCIQNLKGVTQWSWAR
jgi:D-3-phosphoglycerate dehydrogenase / 2-oxoglutarate reductase